MVTLGASQESQDYVLLSYKDDEDPRGSKVASGPSISLSTIVSEFKHEPIEGIANMFHYVHTTKTILSHRY